MARKTLLNESEIRRFMKLASLAPLSELGFSKFSENGEDALAEEDDEEGEDVVDDVEAEIGPDDELDVAAAVDVEEPLDMAPEDELDVGIDDVAPEGDVEDQFMDLVQQLADLVGVDVEMDDGPSAGEEIEDTEIAVDDVEIGDEGGEELSAMGMDMDVEVGAEEEEELPGNRSEMYENEDQLVQEVARRVAARLQADSEKNAVAERLAERIFKRLASK